MKKKAIITILAGLAAMSLSSCNFIYNTINSMVESADNSESAAASKSAESSSSKSSSSSRSEPEPATLTKKTLRYKYSDYQNYSVYDSDFCPSSGSPKLLIIPVWFTDSSNYITTANKEKVRSDIQTAYLGTTSETGWHSVKSFYYEESEHTLNLQGTVSSWYECGKSSSNYRTDDDVSKTTTLVNSAADWYFTNNPSDSRKNYDTDGNGHLDGVMLIYAAPDYGTLGNDDYDNLWAYCYWTENNANTSTPNAGVFFWASYDFMYDSSKASSRTGKTYAAGDCSHCTIDAHTFIHEMGHVFGLDDYYDYSGQYNPAAGFSMQDCNVGGHDPYSVMALGWAKPYIPTDSCKITINAFQSSHDLILLTPEWNTDDSPFDEYLLLELYTPTGLNKLDSDYTYMSRYPKGPSATGIRVWHIDARLVQCTEVDSDGYPVYSSTAKTNPTINKGYEYGVTHMMSNTYWKSSVAGYCSPLGQSYANYNILQLIRNDTSTNYKPTDDFSTSSLFRSGSSFSMSDYSKQFVKSGKLNANKALGWDFSVEINGSGESATATVTCYKD